MNIAKFFSEKRVKDEKAIITILTLVVVVLAAFLNLYLLFFPLPKVSIKELQLKEIETEVDLGTLDQLKRSLR